MSVPLTVLLSIARLTFLVIAGVTFLVIAGLTRNLTVEMPGRSPA